jgi:hypothetical protein
MRTLRIYFADFWQSFDPTDNFFWHLLSQKYRLELDPVHPELLIYSFLGYKDIKQRTFHRYRCLRIFYTGENLAPDYNECDYSLSYEPDSPRNLRVPIYALYNDADELLHRKVPDDLLSRKNRFCCFVVSNPDNPVRNEFFRALSRYKPVDSGGKYLNNVGGPVSDKLAFMKPYKFVISFENESYPGYVTEKVYEPKLADALPIYWGDPGVDAEFNPESFINCHAYDSMDAVIQRIIELDTDDDAYLRYAKAPFFHGDTPNIYVQEARILDFIGNILEKGDTPLAQTWKYWLYLYRIPWEYVKRWTRRLGTICLGWPRQPRRGNATRWKGFVR